MTRSKLKTFYNKERMKQNWDNCRKEKFLWNFTKKNKKGIFCKFLYNRDISSNEKFWKSIKSFFSNKELNSNKLLPVQKVNLVSNEIIIANIFNRVC